MTRQGRGGVQSSRQLAAPRVLERVRRILEETCEQDGQGHILQETARRKAYRQGINRALDELNIYARSTPVSTSSPTTSTPTTTR